MKKSFNVVAVCILVVAIFSCSKKTQPAQPAMSPNVSISNKKTSDTAFAVSKVDSSAIKKAAAKPKAPKTLSSIPKVIVVNDASAKKAVDGRLYYDMQGRRYWRSNKDGKYYLYNKSMHNDEAFKAPKKS